MIAVTTTSSGTSCSKREDAISISCSKYINLTADTCFLQKYMPNAKRIIININWNMKYPFICLSRKNFISPPLSIYTRILSQLSNVVGVRRQFQFFREADECILTEYYRQHNFLYHPIIHVRYTPLKQRG